MSDSEEPKEDAKAAPASESTEAPKEKIHKFALSPSSFITPESAPEGAAPQGSGPEEPGEAPAQGTDATEPSSDGGDSSSPSAPDTSE